MRLADRLRSAPSDLPDVAGSVSTAELSLCWDPDAIQVSRPVTITFDDATIAAVQVSRARLRVGRWRGPRDALIVELRRRDGARLRLCAHADAALLDGLPELPAAAAHVELDVLLTVLDLARHLGATVAHVSAPATQSSPSSQATPDGLAQGRFYRLAVPPPRPLAPCPDWEAVSAWQGRPEHLLHTRRRAPIVELRWLADAQLVSLQTDGTLSIWSATGRLASRIYLDGPVGQLVAPANHAWFVVAGEHGWALITPDGRCATRGPVERPALATTRSGHLLAIATRRDVQVVTMPDMQPLTRLQRAAGNRRALALSDCGRLLALASGGRTLTVVDLTHGRRQEREVPAFIQAMAFAPDRRLAVVDDMGALDIYALRHGQLDAPTARFRCVTGARRLAWMPDASHVAVLSDDTLELVAMPDSVAAISSSARVGQGAAALAISHDGCRAAIGTRTSIRWWQTNPLQACEIDAYDLAASVTDPTPTQVDPTRHTGRITDLAFAPDGRGLASCSVDGTVRLWHRDGRQARVLEPDVGPVLAVAFVGGTSALVCAGRDEVVMWERPGAEPSRHHFMARGRARVHTARLSASGRCVAGVEHGPVLHVLDLTSDVSLVAKLGRQRDIDAVALAPDGEHLVTFDTSRRVVGVHPRPWRDPTLLAREQLASALTVVVPTTGAILFVEGTRTLTQLTVKHLPGVRIDARFEQVLEVDHDTLAAATSLAVSHDGSLVALGHESGQAEIYALSSRQCVARVETRPSTVVAMAFSTDGATLATAHADDRVALWSIKRSAASRRRRARGAGR